MKDEDLYLYYIVSGSVKVLYLRKDLSTLELFHREKGNILQTEYSHFASICNDRLRVVANENTVVSAFTKGQFYELLQKDKMLFDEFLYIVHITYATFSHRLINTFGLSAGEKLLHWLNKLCSITPADCFGGYKLPCQLTQQQIADLLYIHVTTCNKIFSLLEKRRLVKKEKSYIYVYNWEKLNDYLESEEI